MNRKIKALGLAFVALAAMSMAASAAQASELHTTTGKDYGIFGERLTQHQAHQFQTASGAVQCQQALFESNKMKGSAGSQSTAVEGQLTATYTGCNAFGLSATVDMNGCKFTVTNQNSTVTPQTTALRAYVDVTGCTTGKPIEITAAAGCVVTVPEQHHLSHLGFQNVANPTHDVTLQATVSGIKYETHGLCPSSTPTQPKTDGTYHGGATFQARVFDAEQQKTHNNHQYPALNKTGSLVGLQAT